jgi:protein-L-isoaspartate(D-aspartate) O-methyltransferase
MSVFASFAQQRRRMVEQQLARRGIVDPRVLAAMGTVPRDLFLPDELRPEAYADRAVSIDCGQTISQPYIVALMTEALALSGREKVLEVGTGSGYQTAVLARLAAGVVSIERHAALSDTAAARLRQLGIHNVELHVGDGTLGWPADAPFDSIIVTAAAGVVPPALVEQLAEGGRLVIPVGDDRSQLLELMQKTAAGLQTTRLTGCRFVPLVGFCAPDSPASAHGAGD